MTDTTRALTGHDGHHAETGFGLERFRALVENSFDGIAVLGQDGSVTFVSPSAERIMGYSPEEVLGHPPFSFVHPDHVHEAMQAIEQVLAEPGTRLTLESRALHKAGHGVWLELTLTNLLDDPYVEGLVINFRDVSERKGAEELLKETHAKYRSLVEHIPAVLYISEFGANGRWHYVSPYIESLVGVTPEEWINDPHLWAKHIHPSDWRRIAAENDEIAKLQPGQSWETEYRMIARDGRIVWVQDEFRVLHEDDGRVFLQGVMLDVTEKRFTDEALREKEERFRTIFEDAPVGIGLVDLEGRTIESNRMVQQMLGYSDEEFASTSFDEFTHPEDVATNQLLYKEMVRGERDFFRMEKRFIHKDGSIVWGNLFVSLLRDAGGNPLYALGMVENITSRKLLEEQLRQSQKMEAVGRLAGGVAHDFNNLLAVIINCANFLAETIDVDDPRYQDLLDIMSSGERGASLVRQLLAFSRKEIVQPEVIDLNVAVSNMENLLARTLGEDVELTTNLAPYACQTVIDSSQMEQILVNLAVNARDAMPDGGRITIETSQVSVGDDFAKLYPGMKAETYVSLVVADTGMGMTDDVQKHVFEPFFTTKPRGQGTGLGLATTYGAVKQAGGHISVFSEIGRGSRFTLYFPAVSEEAHDGDAGDRDASIGSDGGAVLLVEDDDALRRLTRRMLERHGYSVFEAEAAGPAVEIYERHGNEIDIVLTDVVMPGGSGKELASQLRVVDEAVKVLFMSGYPEDVIAHHGVLEADVPFVGKPFTEETLIGRLRALLEAA